MKKTKEEIKAQIELVRLIQITHKIDLSELLYLLNGKYDLIANSIQEMQEKAFEAGRAAIYRMANGKETKFEIENSTLKELDFLEFHEFSDYLPTL